MPVNGQVIKKLASYALDCYLTIKKRERETSICGMSVHCKH